MNNILSGGILRAVALAIVVIALVVGVLGGIAAAFGPGFLPRAGNVTLDKVSELCLNPKGC